MSTPNVADITERIRQQLAAAEDEDQGEQRQTSEEAAVEHFEERVNGMLAEMLDTGDLDSIPPLEPVVADMLFRDTLARIYGPSGTFKSFMTLDIAACVATGAPWHGQATHAGPVVYLVAEGLRGIRKRVRAWEQHHGRKMTGVKFLPRPVQAMDPEWAVLVEVCRRLAPALVVVDTQARVTVGVEENSNTEMGRVVHHMEQLRAASGACLLLVHHTGHDEGRSRGATAVKGALQTELGVTRKDAPGTGPVITLKTGKQKDDAELDDMEFGIHTVALDGEATEDGSPATSVVLVRLDPVGQAQARTGYQGRVQEIAAALDAVGVPTAAGRDRLRNECSRLGIRAENKVLADVARHRKNQADHLSAGLSAGPHDTGQEETD
ncbi:AAA family ATPase [Streptomyces griseoaurantiacus]|uniref:AAA family ATPase n=1 Tax=Streptomyces griseoaurantiacus TaxID=68213 RepID=UPI0030E2D007